MNAFVMAIYNTIMGMGTVFAVLIFISLIISLFVYIPSAEKKLKRLFSRRKEEAGQESSGEPPSVSDFDEEIEEDEVIEDGELAAVIMAAIAAASEDRAVSADKLVVRSVRRIRKRR